MSFHLLYQWAKMKVLLWDLPYSSPPSFSPHCGGCQSSVLPNKQAEKEKKRRRKGPRGTKWKYQSGEMEERNSKEGMSRVW